MITPRKSPADFAMTEGWVTTEKGYEMTRSKNIITALLKKLKNDRQVVVLLHEGYQSGGCILFDFNENQLLIDRPRDWPGKQKKIQVVFKDSARLWNHFYAEILSATADTLYATFPEEFYQLQRRNHFRIMVPSGCTASFTFNGVNYSGFSVKDISAGGMLMFTTKKIEIPKDSTIKQIAITIPENQPDAEPLTIGCREGRVLRGYINKELKAICYAVRFSPSVAEEDEIIKYVRQRELQNLRLGVS